VVIPIHNEEQRLTTALDGVTRAIDEVAHDTKAALVLVLDTCSDKSATIATEWAENLYEQCSPILTLIVEAAAGNVGVARGLGCDALLQMWGGIDPGAIWIATTDADSCVPLDWLTTQLKAHERGVDLWSGRVSVLDWSCHHPQTALRWTSQYEAELHPIHGTSLGFNAARFLAAGGFPPLQSGEDRALYFAMASNGNQTHHDTNATVVTSARRVGRAPRGFSAALAAAEHADLSRHCDQYHSERISTPLRQQDLAAS
jgi:hypothetical protein